MSLNGEKAEVFMGDRGYEKSPLEANVYTKDKNWSLPEPDGPQWLNDHSESFEKIFSWTYTKQGVNGSYNVLGNYERSKRTTSISAASYTNETWERRRYDYNKPATAPQSPSTKFLLLMLKYVPDLITTKK